MWMYFTFRLDYGFKLGWHQYKFFNPLQHDKQVGNNSTAQSALYINSENVWATENNKKLGEKINEKIL